MSTTIAFVGAGNMARSIIGGLIQTGTPAQSIIASAPGLTNLSALERDFGIRITQDNELAVQSADVVVLSVKPQRMKEVCQQLAGKIHPNTLVVSIAAGILCASLTDWLGLNYSLVRCMPNTPSLVGMGASGLYANSQTSAEQKAIAESLMSAVGIVSWVSDESLIDAVIAVSGSGPAYFFLMLEAMVDAAVAQGLEPAEAKRLAIQTALGAAELARQSDTDLATLRRQVTSPGGTTEQAIKSFEENDYRKIVAKAMEACANRAQFLAKELS